MGCVRAQAREELDSELKEAMKKFKTEAKPCEKIMVRLLLCVSVCLCAEFFSAR